MNITLCTNNKCAFKDRCARFTSKKIPLGETYTKFYPYVDENEDLVCDYFKAKPHKCPRCNTLLNAGTQIENFCKNCKYDPPTTKNSR